MERKVTRESNHADSSKPGWYCLRSQPKHEHIAAAHLRMLDQVTVFCPRIKFKRGTRQGPAWVTEAMFPGYLFAHFELAAMHRQVRYAHGVSGLVQFGGQYPTIEDQALAHLQELTGAAEIKELDYELSQGDPVKIVEGAFSGLEAVVTQVVPARERVKILMDFLGRKVEAELEHDSVLLKVEHPLVA
jgi:transcriptional antiterminator RfaH